MRKRGSLEVIWILFCFITLMLITSTLYFLYMQINVQVYPVKQDIFYIVQNAFLSLDQEELSYHHYVVDEVVLREKIGHMIRLNYENVQLDQIYYDQEKNIVDIRVIVTVKPILLSGKIGTITLNIHEKVKLKEMEL